MRLWRAAVLAVPFVLGCAVADAHACTVIRLEKPEDLIAKSDVIVRAKAVEQLGKRLTWDETRALLEQGKASLTTIGTRVLFEVVEVIKGETPARLEFDGEITTNRNEDGNDPGVPRTFVRRGGRHGNCYALQYRPGAEYLLILRHQGKALTPYWSALAPVNEHVNGSEDPWLCWVRTRAAQR